MFLLKFRLTIAMLSFGFFGLLMYHGGNAAQSTADISLAPAKTVIVPHQPGGFEAGINFYINTQDYSGSDDLEHKLNSILDRLVDNNLNAVSLVWSIYTGDVNSSSIFMGPGTPTDQDLALIIEQAHKRGFIVTIRPTIDERSIMNDRQDWRGTIRPTNVDQWFAEYTAVMLRYAALAQAHKVHAFVVGAELNSMEKYITRWKTLITSVDEVFGGLLSYSSNQGFNPKFPWKHLDYVGIDAFFELTTPANGATAEDMLKSAKTWVAWARRKVVPAGLPIILAEVGTRAQQNAHKKSWLWGHNTPLDLDDQSNYYQAICKAWKPLVQGIYWWNVTLNLPEDLASDSGFVPLGKPAEAQMSSCFSS
jgi:hypothetical protein